MKPARVRSELSFYLSRDAFSSFSLHDRLGGQFNLTLRSLNFLPPRCSVREGGRDKIRYSQWSQIKLESFPLSYTIGGTTESTLEEHQVVYHSSCTLLYYQQMLNKVVLCTNTLAYYASVSANSKKGL
jgi:hypothetical protein